MGKKSSGVKKTSLGGGKAANKRHEEKRQAYFARRREAGKNYVYNPNPFKKDTEAYEIESLDRLRKNIDGRLPLAMWTSIFAKLDNTLAKEERKRKDAESNSKKTK